MCLYAADDKQQTGALALCCAVLAEVLAIGGAYFCCYSVLSACSVNCLPDLAIHSNVSF